jgi:hypothetical protein
MSRRERRDGDRRPSERRDSQPDEEQQRHPGDADVQEGDSLTALKAILAKVAALLQPLKLTQEESISLVEQLYGSVLETDVKLAGEADDRRKSSVLAHIENTTITRSGDKIVVDYPKVRKADAPEKALTEAAPSERAPAEAAPSERAPAEAAASEGAAADTPAAEAPAETVAAETPAAEASAPEAAPSETAPVESPPTES